MITFDNVVKRYPGSHEALSNVSFTIEQGEMVYVTGHSGAGKSTLLKLMAAIERPTSGTVLINNQNVNKLKEATLPFIRRKFGLVFQDHKLLYDRNCYHNVALPLAINGIMGAEAGKRIRAALDKVGLLAKEKSMPITLSGGEQQRLAIARVLLKKPTWIFADEATAALDEFNPFNLILANSRNATFLSNRPEEIRTALTHGIYGLSNGALDEPWPKTLQLKAALSDWLVSENPEVEPLFAALRNEQIEPIGLAPDEPSDITDEAALTPVFIRRPVYGTRCSTVVLVDTAGDGRIVERIFDTDGVATGETAMSFSWSG